MARASILQATVSQEPEIDSIRPPSIEPKSQFSASSAGLPPLITEPTTYLPSIPTVASPISTNKELPPPPPVDSPTSPEKKTSIPPRPSLDFSLPQLESDSDDDLRRPTPKEYSSQVRYSAHLSAAESSSISKWSDEVIASTVKPKQKRTSKSQHDSTIRPKTSGAGSEVAYSRRSNLPTTVRMPIRPSAQSSRPGSQQSTRSVPARLMPSSDLPAVPLPTIPAGHRKMPSQGQQSHSQGSSIHEHPAMTPEKLRLMKALQMRKRKQLLTQRSNTAPPTPEDPRASNGSSQSALSEIVRVKSSPMDPDTASQIAELNNKHQSQTTSPISVLTTSDNHSTKPSSLSEDSPESGSRISLSSATGSSTTPKAEGEEVRQAKDTKQSLNPTNRHDVEESNASLLAETQGTAANTEIKSMKSRPLTYQCATADFLADIEEEDRDRPLSVIKTDKIYGGSGNNEQQHKQRMPFDSPVSQMVPTNADTSDISDDECLMDELQNATVHEAKPVSVNRTPATPVLSSTPMRMDPVDLSSEPASGRSDRSLPGGYIKHSSRSPSNDSQMSTSDMRRAVSRAGSTKSLSTALPQWPPPTTEPMPALPKQRPIMGASISKRVKTFEGLSKRDSLVFTPTTKETVSRSTSLSTMLKRTSFLPHSSVDELPEKISSNTTISPLSSPLRSTFNSPEQELTSKPWLQRPGTGTEVYSPTQKGDSVSVTAHIVRDPAKPMSAHGTSDTARNLYVSPLVVEHEKVDKLQLRPPVNRELSTQSMDSLATSPSLSERRRFSFSSHRSGGQKTSPVETKFHRLSFVGHKKSHKSPADSTSVAEEKKQSRTSRMLKRLSGLGKARGLRDTMAGSVSPSREEAPLHIAEEPADTEDDHEPGPMQASIRHVVDIGEVNVQFADTLLWKRRFLRVDDQGYLIFAPPTNDSSARGKSRKIHLDELQRPALPDLEREEMAWSILLDLKNGGTVQCACESKKAQGAVLKSEFPLGSIFSRSLLTLISAP